ncbi:ABC-type multidrug transport system fused ATPase/permease subunit [Virgibacillus halotolerans]|uniref:J domain-containing protein n=1 Tax=Virgibacillus halotolerans TaxID=1071053 RepID=UPI001961DE5A|nr:J domain-containing protein [Virgibacillus halotolerans]MBM7598238.1 ABC-type multidrug transport system fused ATPase/permease subunit [Virgibacillus halotolerans]
MKIFSFFKFYYYVITNNSKQYSLAMNSQSFTIIAMTPVVLMTTSLILTGILISLEVMLLNFLLIPLFVLNLFFVMTVGDEGHVLKWKKESERIQARRDEIERELERKRREQERIERERERLRSRRELDEEFNRLWQEYMEAKEQYQRDYQQGQRRSHFNIDRNMKNAMHLLGLNEGFTKKDVKSGYRKMSKIHHPDVGGLEENFKRLNVAYQYIMDRI